jgi:hypothetical protein
MKLLHSERYKGFDIEIYAKYIEEYYDWNEHWTNAVRLEYTVFSKEGHPVYIERFQHTVVPKKKPWKLLFWKIKPKTTFEDDVKEELNDTIEFIKKKIDIKFHEKEMTDGLLDSLKGVK